MFLWDDVARQTQNVSIILWRATINNYRVRKTDPLHFEVVQLQYCNHHVPLTNVLIVKHKLLSFYMNIYIYTFILTRFVRIKSELCYIESIWLRIVYM